MAFDSQTRNKLQRMVGECRRLLTDEFDDQLQSLYGIYASEGRVLDLEKLKHLDDDHYQVASLLRDRIEHLRSGHLTEKDALPEAIRRVLREQAFTVLNRFAALRMAEERSLVQECVAQGLNSKGFQVFEQVARSGLGGAYDRYRVFIHCVFDELSLDLGVLFDRYSPFGLLFPREQALLRFFDLLNAAHLKALWKEDETIGWIYQYFNDEAERKKMREGSAAPRNSRELAVRNQFFTPRYVVQFLTDNTLGRIWYEMTQGQTRLKEECQYLVRRPDEVFLAAPPDIEDGIEGALEWLQNGTGTKPDVWALHGLVNGYLRAGDAGEESNCWVEERLPRIRPETIKDFSTQELLDLLFLICRKERFCEGTLESLKNEVHLVQQEIEARVTAARQENLSQEELLKQPVFVPHRPLKDPRTILMLDPACGSMHFGLYAFDLYETIYAEAWDLEDRGAKFGRTAELKSLHETFSSKEEFLRAVPKLIIENNIHGIDIDPRCAQIAGLSLWLRAQKSWQALNLKPADRPRIARSNIVCAEPMPGEKALLEEFIEQQFGGRPEKDAIAYLVGHVFERMRLAGEAGSLLKIEEEIHGVISEAKKRWKAQREEFFDPAYLTNLDQRTGRQREMTMELSGITDEAFFHRAEQFVYDALRNYSEQAENGGGFQRRLFAEDAAGGFAFIDVCRRRYDVVVMNPPFGLFTERALGYAKENYTKASNDFYAAFVQRGLTTLNARGAVGVISSRLGFFLEGLESWREDFMARRFALRLLADLGYGVLDALVETAVYVIDGDFRNDELTAISALSAKEKHAVLNAAIRSLRVAQPVESVRFSRLSALRLLPGKVLAYWLSSTFLARLSAVPPLKARDVSVYSGLQTDDDFRFLRLWWECPEDRFQSGWIPFAKGGEYQPYADDLHLCVNWENGGTEMKEFVASKYLNWSRHIKNTERYFIAGLTYSERTTSDISVRAFPEGAIFSVSGPVLQFNNEDELYVTWAYLNCRLGRALIEMAVGSGDTSRSGTAARHYRTGILADTPCPRFPSPEVELFRRCVIELYRANIHVQRSEETHALFDGVPLNQGGIDSLAKAEWLNQLRTFEIAASNSYEIDRTVRSAFGISEEEVSLLAGPHPWSQPGNVSGEALDELNRIALLDESALCALALDRGVHPRTSTKKTFFFSRELELLSAITGCHPPTIVAHLSNASTLWERRRERCAADIISRALGCALGRWQIRDGTGEKPASKLPDPFARLPVCPPGQLQNARGLPAGPEDVPPEYPIRIPWNGILVDDPSHPLDIERRVREVIGIIAKDKAEAIEHEACEILGVKTVRDYFRRPAVFFADHLKRYSKSRRQAPIYWPLATASGAYTLWIYYHRLSDQTLFHCVNEFVKPKMEEIGRDVERLQVKLRDGGSAKERQELQDTQDLLAELTEFRDEILRVAALPYKPNLNDGVLITASPLWKLFRLPKWQKDLKACWEELSKGEYDWAHLAYSIWPDRVKDACKTDHSIAIAHGLEELCEVKPPVKKSKRGRKLDEQMELD